MNKNDYVGIIEPRCSFYRNRKLIPSNQQEKILFKLVVPDFYAPQAQLTGAEIYISKMWDESKKAMRDISSPLLVGRCLDVMTSKSIEERLKRCLDLTIPEWEEKEYLPYDKRNYIIGYPRPIIGIFADLRSEKANKMLKLFDTKKRKGWNNLTIGETHKENSYIPVENILGYESPKRFLEKEDGFTGQMLIDWPPTKKWADEILKK
jgi:hypothetical protein